jgi:hypothetical protein
MSPRLRPCEHPVELKAATSEEEMPLLAFLPLKKETTRTTHASLPMESQFGSDPKI